MNIEESIAFGKVFRDEFAQPGARMPVKSAPATLRSGKPSGTAFDIGSMENHDFPWLYQATL